MENIGGKTRSATTKTSGRKIQPKMNNDLKTSQTVQLKRKTEEIVNFLFRGHSAQSFFSGAGVWRSTPKRPRMLGRKGNNEKGRKQGRGRAAAQGKAFFSVIPKNKSTALVNCGQKLQKKSKQIFENKSYETAKMRNCLTKFSRIFECGAVKKRVLVNY